jgi:cytochrome b6-f complex iron-sulfur subunit
MHTNISRRHFLQVIVATGAVSALPGCNGGGDSSPEAFGDVGAGNVSELAVGSIQAVSNAPAYIARDASGLYAMTSTCTHAGCDMIASGAITSQGIACHCHGSVFDKNGNVVTGPANSALAHFAVSVDAAGAITVHGGQTVAQSERTAVA